MRSESTYGVPVRCWSMRAIVVVVLLLASSVAAASAPVQRSRLFEQWKKADASGDGELSRSEAARVPRLAAHFDTIDRDGNGRLSAEEVRAWRKAVAASRRTPVGRRFDQYFKQADIDGDGALSRAEIEAGLPRMAGKFGRIDSDRNGRLTREEIENWFALRRSARGR